jgi:hypothetical protein
MTRKLLFTFLLLISIPLAAQPPSLAPLLFFVTAIAAAGPLETVDG